MRSTFLGLLLGGLILIAGSALLSARGSSEARPVAAAATLAGKVQVIDVSEHQGSIRWGRVQRSGIDAVILKASEGATYSDPWATPKRIRAIEKAGLPYGLYHFLRPGRRDAALEAELFMERAVELGGWGEISPAIDVEATRLRAKATATYLARFIETLRAAGGPTHLMIYASPRWWSSHVAITPRLREALAGVAAWSAHWNVSRPEPLAGIDGVALHQYTERGRVAGIKGYVDRNRAADAAKLLR